MLESNCKFPVFLFSVTKVSVAVQSVASKSRLYNVMSFMLAPGEILNRAL